MDYSAAIIALLSDYPSWSNAAIARRVGCEQRRVRRYRRVVLECGQPLEELRRLSPSELRTVLNERPSRTPPDFARLREEFPHASGRGLWRRYVTEALTAGQRPLSRSHFLRHLSVWSVRQAGEGEPRC